MQRDVELQPTLNRRQVTSIRGLIDIGDGSHVTRHDRIVQRTHLETDGTFEIDQYEGSQLVGVIELC